MEWNMNKQQVQQASEPDCPWESGQLGLSEEHAAVAGVEHEKSVDESLALQLISIRLPKALIEDLKFLAVREGLGYQPLVRRVLMRFVEGEMKAIAYEQLIADQRKQGHRVAPNNTEAEPCERQRKVATR